jgi:hypothetical protein
MEEAVAAVIGVLAKAVAPARAAANAGERQAIPVDVALLGPAAAAGAGRVGHGFFDGVVRRLVPGGARAVHDGSSTVQ